MAEHFGQDLLLLDKLAAGGMAEVYRGKQLGVGGFEKTIAVKRILPHFAQNEEFKQMFRMEANLCAHLQHPNIVQVFSNGEWEGYLYLCMEFVDGKNVRQMLAAADRKKVKIPIEYALFMVAEAAKGLEYAHNYADETTGQPLKIVHRDMSPQNIMLGYEGTVKIVDFGIAKAAARNESTKAGVLKGKFGYMSPEQAMGMEIDKRTDVFALGIILFELLTQRRLFTADDDLKTLQLVRDCKIPRPSKYNPDVPPNLDNLVKRVLAKERSERYATAADFYKDLMGVLNAKWPRFIATDIAVFLKSLFSEDILEDRKRREKLAAEAPARLANTNVPERRAPAEAQDLPPSEDRTQVTNPNSGDSEKTRVATKVAAAAPPKPVNIAESEHLSLSATGDEAVRVIGENTNTNLTPMAGFELPSPKTSQGHQLASDSTRIAPVRTPQSVNANQNRPAVGSPAPYSGKGNIQWARIAIVLLVIAGAAGFFLKKDSGENRQSASAEAPEVLVAETPASDTQVVASTAKPESTVPPSAVETQGKEGIPPAVQEIIDQAPVQGTAPAPTAPVPVVAKGNSDTFNYKVTRGPAGYLSLSSVPEGKEIYINGQLMVDDSGTPLTTPLRGKALPVGKHRLEVKNSTFGKSWSGEIDVKADRILDESIQLK